MANTLETSNGLVSDSYCLLAQDIGEISELEKALCDIGLKKDRLTLFLSECAITYMEEEKSRNIITWASTFPDLVFLIYEQIYPDDGFSQAMMKHYDNLRLPLWSVEVYCTKEDQIHRFKKCGFDCGWSGGAFEIYKKALSSDAHESVVTKEPFDEWEEWHLTSSHYTLSVGTRGMLNELFAEFMEPHRTERNAALTPCNWELQKSVSLQFFGHSAVEIWKNTGILVVGGFGLSQDNRHMRLTQLCLISLPDMQITFIDPPKMEGVSWDCVHHTCSLLLDSAESSEFLLYGGRTSPLKSSNVTPLRVCISKSEDKEITLTARKVQPKGEGPHPRRRHTATAVGGSTLVFAGVWTHPDSKEQLVFNDAWLLTKEENWIKLKSKPPARFSHSAVAADDTVYIVGGIGDKTTLYSALSDVWSYNISGDVWTQYEIDIIPRYSLTCHVFGNILLLLGGVNELSERQPGLTLINLSSTKVQEYKLPGSSRDLPIMLHNHASVVCSDKEGVLVIGGGGHCFSFGTYFNRHPVTIRLPSFSI